MSSSVFDKLVTSLSTSERRQMLERIAESVDLTMSEGAEFDSPAVDLEASFSRMGVVRRLIVIVVAFFSGRERLSVVEGYLLRDLRRSVSARIPHGFDSVQMQLKPGALSDVRDLSSAARVFGAVLGRVMGAERRAFITFLAALHAPETQARLIEETDSFEMGRQNPDAKESDIRRRVLKACEDALAVVPPSVRGAIYSDVRGLHNLMLLASFPFDRVQSAFMPVADGDPVPAPITRIADEIARLACIFAGLGTRISPKLFEALVLHQQQEDLEVADEVLERAIRDDVDRLAKAYAKIAAFGKRYPLADLVRLAHSNLHYHPTAYSGGEDWFAQWKGFWRERIEANHRRYAYGRRVESILREASETLGLSGVEPFPGYPPSGIGRPARHGLSLGLTHAFVGQVYKPKLSSVVGVLYKEGEFYKSENRSDLDRIYHEIERFFTDLANLEVRLRPTGDLAMAWKQAHEPALPADAALERQESFVVALNSDASALNHRFVESFRSLGDILQGVLFGTVGGRFDTVSNLAELGGSRAHNAYMKKLEEVHVKVKAVASFVSDLMNVETMAAQAKESGPLPEREG